MNNDASAVGASSDLVEALSHFGVRYLVADERYSGSQGEHSKLAGACPGDLALALARSSDARLQSALVALLLRHPEYAAEIEASARVLPDNDPDRQLMLLSIVVAAALQSNWSWALSLYLGRQPAIRADHLSNHLGLSHPCLEFGQPCLRAAAAVLRHGNEFPVNYAADWNNALNRLLSQLAREARPNGA